MLWPHPNLHCLLELVILFLSVVAPPQLALFVEFLFEILCVGAPRVLKKLVISLFSFSQLLPI
ncbi:hypothetical protein B6175_06585 [Staphylococcus aureus]|nr:hypothetical protein B6175_06585 [Staphylococcus aureus]